MRTDNISTLIENLSTNTGHTFIANLANFRDGDDSAFHLIDHCIIRPAENCGLNNEQLANGPLQEFYKVHSIDTLAIPSTYYRWCSGSEEYKWATQRQLNVSTNHRANKILNGISVAEGPWLYLKPHSYVYFLTGDVIGRGPDGEPLLSRDTISVVTELLTKKQLLTAFHLRNEPKLLELSRAHSISVSRLLTFLLGNF